MKKRFLYSAFASLLLATSLSLNSCSKEDIVEEELSIENQKLEIESTGGGASGGSGRPNSMRS